MWSGNARLASCGQLQFPVHLNTSLAAGATVVFQLNSASIHLIFVENRRTLRTKSSPEAPHAWVVFYLIE